MKKITTDKAPQSNLYSQGIHAGNFVFVSGQLPVDPKTGTLIEGDIEKLTHQAIDNVEAILVAAGLTLDNVVRVDVFLANMDDFQAMNKAYAERFRSPSPPARQTIQACLPRNGSVEISCIAFIHK